VADRSDPPLLGGHLALDFANSLDGRGSARERDRLTDYPALVAWALAAGAADRGEAADLRAYADWAPGSAAQALAEAKALREAVYRAAAAIASGAAPEPADLDALNRRLAPILSETRLSATPAGLAPAWGGGPDALERVLWPVARAAFELLSGAAAGRLRQCAGADCRRLFLDRSKNGSRRWCAMSDCGNLAKARRHRARTTGGVKPGDQAA
jgi:predicted RNA-binding Zn ribbon-like protein